MDNIFHNQTLPITFKELENNGFDTSNCIQYNDIKYNNLIDKYYVEDEDVTLGSKNNTSTGCYRAENASLKNSTYITISGSNESVYHKQDISKLQENSFQKLMRYILYSFVLTLTLGIIICFMEFWLIKSQCIKVTSIECNNNIGNNIGNKKNDDANLLDYLFPDKLWNWPYINCDKITTTIGGGNVENIKSIDRYITINIENSDNCKTDTGSSDILNKQFPYTILNQLENNFPNNHIIKIIPKYSVYLILITMLTYRRLTKYIINSLSMKNNSNSKFKIVRILLLTIFLLPILSLVYSTVLPFLSIILFIIVLFIHLHYLNNIVKHAEENTNTETYKYPAKFALAIFLAIPFFIFHEIEKMYTLTNDSLFNNNNIYNIIIYIIIIILLLRLIFSTQVHLVYIIFFIFMLLITLLIVNKNSNLVTLEEKYIIEMEKNKDSIIKMRNWLYEGNIRNKRIIKGIIKDYYFTRNIGGNIIKGRDDDIIMFKNKKESGIILDKNDINIVFNYILNEYKKIANQSIETDIDYESKYNTIIRRIT